MKKTSPVEKASRTVPVAGHNLILSDLVALLDTARRASARTVNAIMTATYWEIGRRIVELEQKGKGWADYGDELLKKWPTVSAKSGAEILSTALRGSQDGKCPTVSGESSLEIPPTPAFYG